MRAIKAHIGLILAAVLVAIAAVGIVASISNDSGGRAPAPVVTLGGPGAATIPNTPAVRQHVRELQDAAGDDDVAPDARPHEDLRAEPPAARSPELLERHEDLKPPGQPMLPLTVPLAAPSVPGCTTRLVRNSSSRGGSPILIGVIHYTASPPLLGWTGVWGNTNWFDQLAARASSNEIISRDGKCALVVPEPWMAWTQAGFNRPAVSVEIVTDGTPATLMTPAGDMALSRLLVGWHRRWGIPLRRAVVRGCEVVRTGIADHKQLGDCGGNHGDIGRYDVDAVIANARGYLAATSSPLTTVERRIVRGVARPAGTGHSRRFWCQRAVQQRAQLRAVGREPGSGGWGARDRGDRSRLLGRAHAAHCR